MEVFFGWLIFSFVVGAMGSNRKIGFFGALLLSIFLSLIIGLIVVLISKDKKTEQYETKILAMQQQQVELLRNMQQSAQKDTNATEQSIPLTIEDISLPLDPNVRAARLKDLRNRGIISEQEFYEQIRKI